MGHRASRRRRVLAQMLAGLVLMMLAAAPAASAHAVLQSCTPATGSVVKAADAPTRVELTFDEPVEVSLGAIEVVAGDGHRVDSGAVFHPSGAGERVSVGLRSRLGDGSYLVLWRVVSADSHPVHGSYSFAVGRPGNLASAVPSGSPRSLAVALWSARFAGYAGLLLLIGLAGFLTLCQPRLWGTLAARRLLRVALSLTGGAAIVDVAVQAAVDVGGGWSSTLDPATLRALLDTRLGHAHLARVLLLVLIWLMLRRLTALGQTMRAALSIAVLAVIATVAVEGHARRTAYTAVMDIVHLAAAGAWLGGLVVLLLLVLPGYRQSAPTAFQDPPTGSGQSGVPSSGGSVAVLDPVRLEPVSWVAVRRFSRVAFVSVALLLASGVLQALRQVPEWGALTGTTYGRLLLFKVGLVLATLAVAAVSTSVLHTRRGGTDGLRRAVLLGRTVAVETAVLVLVLAVTSALVGTTPAAAAYRPAQERTVYAGPVTLDISVVPETAHTLDIHLYAYGSNGALADVQTITAQALPASTGGLGPVSIPFLQAGTGHFIANRVLLPATGRWTLTLNVRTGEFDAYPATTTLTVR